MRLDVKHEKHYGHHMNRENISGTPEGTTILVCCAIDNDNFSFCARNHEYFSFVPEAVKTLVLC